MTSYALYPCNDCSFSYCCKGPSSHPVGKRREHHDCETVVLRCACCRVLLCQEPAAPAKDAKEEDPAAEAKDLPEGMGWPSHPGNRHALSTAFQRGEQIWVWLPYISWPDDELR